MHSLFAQDSWQRHPDPDAERRPALGRAAALQPGQQTSCRRRRWRTSAACPASATAAPTAAATSTRRARTRDDARVQQFAKGTQGYKTDWNNLRPERRASPGGRTCRTASCGAARRSRPGDAARRVLGRLRTPGHGHLHRPVRHQSRQHARPEPERSNRARRSRRSLAGAPQPEAPALQRRRSRRPRRSRSRRAPIARTTSTPSRPTSRSRRRAPGPSASSAPSARTWRSTSATSGPAASTSGRS